MPATVKRRRTAKSHTKVFVLDTNVLMHDPNCLFRFEEHDVFIPMMTLEELDNHKKGQTEVARNARQATRLIDQMLEADGEAKIADGVSLLGPSKGLASGKLFLQAENMDGALPDSLPKGKADHLILSVITHMKENPAYKGRQIILVTKDLNIRIKARTIGVTAQDYLSDKVLEDTDLLYPGMTELPSDFWEQHSEGLQSKKKDDKTVYRVSGPLCPSLLVNQLVWSDEFQLDALVREVSGRKAVIETLTDYTNPKHSVWGIMARNREQNFALNLLMDPNVDFVTLVGQAGTGKTLLTLAAGLMQVLEVKLYSEIIMTRVTVPVGEDIGFLPGTEEDKMSPWMGALEDNLDVLGLETSSEAHEKNDPQHGKTVYSPDWSKAATRDMMRSRIKVKSLNFMRGRTFLMKYVIIDEAQNLTPKQMKTLITRAGPGTKIVCLGNLAQIDTPYLTEGSSGLAYVVDRFKGWEHGGHVILKRGERSRLADHANDVL